MCYQSSYKSKDLTLRSLRPSISFVLHSQAELILSVLSWFKFKEGKTVYERFYTLKISSGLSAGRV